MAFHKLIATDSTTEKKMMCSAYCRMDRYFTKKPLYIVGAGPGDPELLTVAAHKCIMCADVVIADMLVPKAITNLVPDNAILEVADKAGRPDEGKREVDDWILQYLSLGLTVVRLKGGDPSVFARLAEEKQLLRENGYTWKVIPGVSSFLAAAATADTPLTQRGITRGFTVWTASSKGGATQTVPRFQPDHTLVVLMGAKRAHQLMESLVTAGYPVDTPLKVVENCSCNNESVYHGSIKGLLGDLRKDKAVQSPAVIIVGPNLLG